MPPAPLPVDAVDPAAAYGLLAEDGGAMVDVRTRAEWTFVGLPDLSATGRPLWLVEWARFPDMAPNPALLARLSGLIEEHRPERLFFLCRSGVRSLAAARLVAEAAAAADLRLRCANVAEGFEGDPDAQGRRGRLCGWKARGLPWSQS